MFKNDVILRKNGDDIVDLAGGDSRLYSFASSKEP